MVETLRLKLKEQKGFTLIELLAVIVILGIIAAIAIPAIGNVINKSQSKAKVQDALLVLDAAKLYVADNNLVPASGTTATYYFTLEGATSGADGSEVAKAYPLNGYLDRVKDKDFEVKITYTAGTYGAKYSYEIGNHEAVPVVTANNTTKKAKATGVYVTEKELSTFAQ